jgi:hypothetical protein
LRLTTPECRIAGNQPGVEFHDHLHPLSELDLDAAAPEIFNEESSRAVGGKGESVVGERRLITIPRRGH